MRYVLPLCYLLVSGLTFWLYGYFNPQPSILQLAIFFILVVLVITGFAVLTNAVISFKDGKVSNASGPIAAMLGALVIILPFIKDIGDKNQTLAGKCNISGEWICGKCQNRTASINELTHEDSVREIQMKQNSQTYSGSFLVDRNVITFVGLQSPQQSAIGFIAPGCKRVDWNYGWVWER